MAFTPVNRETGEPITLSVLQWLATLNTPEAAQWVTVWETHTPGASSPEFDAIWNAYVVANNVEMVSE